MINVINATVEHISDIHKIEESCFTVPWSKSAFEKEIKTNKFAIYVVAYDDEANKVVGYGGMWHVINEGHITNIAVSEEYRRQGVGFKIVKRLIEIAEEKEMIGLTLEVRRGNQKAMGLYRKNGFIISGIRPEYYSDTKEDAIIMWKYLVPEEMIEIN